MALKMLPTKTIDTKPMIATTKKIDLQPFWCVSKMLLELALSFQKKHYGYNYLLFAREAPHVFHYLSKIPFLWI